MYRYVHNHLWGVYSDLEIPLHGGKGVWNVLPSALLPPNLAIHLGEIKMRKIKLAGVIVVIVYIVCLNKPATGTTICQNCRVGCMRTYNYCIGANFQPDIDCAIDHEICHIGCDYVCGPHQI